MLFLIEIQEGAKFTGIAVNLFFSTTRATKQR